jgi:hypothetical protein
VDGVSAENTYIEQYVAYNFTCSPIISAKVTLTSSDIVRIVCVRQASAVCPWRLRPSLSLESAAAKVAKIAKMPYVRSCGISQNVGVKVEKNSKEIETEIAENCLVYLTCSAGEPA